TRRDHDRRRRNRHRLGRLVLHEVVGAEGERAAGGNRQDEHHEQTHSSHMRSCSASCRCVLIRLYATAATSTPIAIAGAYAKRFPASACSISAIAPAPFAISRRVRSIVLPSRRRRTATTAASRPPAIAV